LAESTLPERATRRFPPYREMANPAERRLAIVRLCFEGWNVKSIAGYLETTRTRVYDTLRRCVEEGVRGMADQSRAPKAPSRKADLGAMAAIRRLRANPELGEFRVDAALTQLGIELSPRTCGRILAQHRALYDLAGPAAGIPHDPKAPLRGHTSHDPSRCHSSSPSLLRLPCHQRRRGSPATGGRPSAAGAGTADGGHRAAGRHGRRLHRSPAARPRSSPSRRGNWCVRTGPTGPAATVVFSTLASGQQTPPRASSAVMAAPGNGRER
jgi:hypothetical protein